MRLQHRLPVPLLLLFASPPVKAATRWDRDFSTGNLELDVTLIGLSVAVVAYPFVISFGGAFAMMMTSLFARIQQGSRLGPLLIAIGILALCLPPARIAWHRAEASPLLFPGEARELWGNYLVLLAGGLWLNYRDFRTTWPSLLLALLTVCHLLARVADHRYASPAAAAFGWPVLLLAAYLEYGRWSEARQAADPRGASPDARASG